MVLLVVAMLVLTVMGFATAAQNIFESERRQDDKCVFRSIPLRRPYWLGDDARLKTTAYSTSLREVWFDQIASGWATTTYNHLDSKSKVIPGDTWTYILHKTKGKWQVAMKSEPGCNRHRSVQEIGLPQSCFAKKLKVLMDWD